MFFSSSRRSSRRLLLHPSVYEAHQQPHGELLVEHRLPGEHLPDGVGYLGGRGVFEHEPRGARPEGVREVASSVEGGQDEHEGIGELPLYRAGGRDTVHLGHAEIHEYQIGTQAAAKLYCLPAVGRFSDHLDGGVRLKDVPQRGTEEGMIVGYDDPRRSSLGT